MNSELLTGLLGELAKVFSQRKQQMAEVKNKIRANSQSSQKNRTLEKRRNLSENSES